MFSLTLTASLVACTGGNGGYAAPPDATTAADPPTQESSTPAPIFGKPILFQTQVHNAEQHVGIVLRTSVIGESAFCRGGRTSGGSEGAAITTTFHCRDGTLQVRYSPIQRSLVQGAAWDVVGGTGSMAGLRGGGSMVAIFEKGDPDTGRETFTGTVGE